MESINNNLSNLILNKTLSGNIDKLNVNQQLNKGQRINSFDNAGACILNNMSTTDFDIITDNLVNFSDILGTAHNSIDEMRAQGERLLALINKAHSDEANPEMFDSMNAEASSLISEINNIFQNTEFNGINPLQTPFGINIPNWQNVIQQMSGIDSIDETTDENNNTTQNAITNVLADINFDFDFQMSENGKSLNLQASANIQIGFTDDGALQIVVDASLDFDLSGIENEGVQSDNALEIITNFLSLLKGTQDDLNIANSFLNSLFASSNAENSENTPNSSQLKGQILQQATISLDGAYQMPNIAINIL